MMARPNQSLKLTEVAVNDFAARQYAENDKISRYVRAMNYMELAIRRRSLAPVRLGGLFHTPFRKQSRVFDIWINTEENQPFI